MSQEYESVDVAEESTANPGNDVEMEEGASGAANGDEDGALVEIPLPDDSAVAPARPTFASYLMSPVVYLIVGSEEPVTLTVHQDLLTQSPHFQEACNMFIDDGSVSFFPSAGRALRIPECVSSLTSGCCAH